MAVVLLLSMGSTTFAASALELTYHIECDDYVYVAADDASNYRIEVPSGTVLTVDFFIEADENFELSTFQNEIFFDPDFFSYMMDSAETEKAGTSCALKEYSDGEMRVFVNSVTDTSLSTKQKIASFNLLVTEETVGAVSLIETKLPKASDNDGVVSSIMKKNLEVKIIDGNANLKKHSVTYKDGSAVLEQFNVIKGQEISLNENNIEKDDVVFDGWKINGSEIKRPGDKITVNADINIEAVWKAKTEHLIHFNTNGGSSVPSVKGYEGNSITLTQTSTRSGYIFDGWYSDSSLTTRVSSITLTADTTVYAKWKKENTGSGGGGGGGVTTKYTVSFKTTDGIVLDTIQKASGSTLALSAYTFAKEGYKFDGWYTDKNLTDKVTSVKIDKDITLYAKWVEAPQEQQGGNRPSILTDVHHAYIVGRENNLVAPQENITRAEVATIFFRLLTDEIRNDYYSKENTFDDVNLEDWFNTAVSTLTNIGIISGRSDTQFAPNAYITRSEFATIAARFSKGEYDGETMFTDISGHWAESYINRAAFLGWIVGDNGLFRPDDFITRAEAMTLTNRVLGRQPESIDDILTDDMVKFIDNADVNAWYYLAIQEATNSHDYEMKADGKHEKWTRLTENPDWSKLEK